MKKQTKITLDRETVRRLDHEDLRQQVLGGALTLFCSRPKTCSDTSC